MTEKLSHSRFQLNLFIYTHRRYVVSRWKNFTRTKTWIIQLIFIQTIIKIKKFKTQINLNNKMPIYYVKSVTLFLTIKHYVKIEVMYLSVLFMNVN